MQRPLRPRRPLLPASLMIAVAGWCTTTSAAQPAVLVTTDGQRFRGQLIVETEEIVVLEVGGIETRFDRGDVESLEFPETAEQEYERERADLRDSNLSGRYELAFRMYERRAFEVAKRELVSLDQDFPQTPRVVELLNIVDAQLRLETSRGSAEQNAQAEGSPTFDRSERSRDPRLDRYLSDEQINLIRVYEINLGEQPRVAIPGPVMDEAFARFADQPGVPRGRRAQGEFKRRPGYEQLALLFDLRAREFYPQVQVRQEPAALTGYRRSANANYVARYFAPLFGQGAIEGLTLLSDRPDLEEEAYTNFYSLSTFTYDGLPMIDRLNPELSLLLQWGLEREAARHPAPEIEGWRPQYRSTQDPEFLQQVEWIERLYDDLPDYGFRFEPGGE
jgi:hypothetical protein